MNLLFIVSGLILLILGGNWLLKSAVSISLRLNIPKIVIGMTVVSFATSAPELIVSVKSALNGFPDLAMGNVVGSNVANLGLVLAVTIILSPIQVERSFYKTDWPVMMISSCVLFGFVAFDNSLQRYEGIILVLFLIIFLIYLLKVQKPAVVEELEVKEEAPLSVLKTGILLGLGGVCLWGGSELLISGAVGMAEFYGVSKRVIAVTVVSIGTSVPELAASIIAVMKKEKAISLGNLIGSNMFNILAVLGVTSIIQPIIINDKGLLTNDIYWMLGISFIILPLVFLPRGLRLGWRDGIILLGLYGIFVWTIL
ncbi:MULTISPECIES: calcium/sodium antiporter [Galbibacter]|uniref:K+dependent Na+ exchanger related-protein n=1 Tax=Galbibacter orientalis DSM 19592 TaxID=926559 RepID=I3C7F1_9FLAO|nr:calcium/sodium antiporter [Galbibacter orientalis]EIJ39544.1 K+dependent Na+ exchanger related-protein [Galbibacter orientalis DSM 19592]